MLSKELLAASAAQWLDVQPFLERVCEQVHGAGWKACSPRCAAVLCSRLPSSQRLTCQQGPLGSIAEPTARAAPTAPSRWRSASCCTARGSASLTPWQQSKLATQRWTWRCGSTRCGPGDAVVLG